MSNSALQPDDEDLPPHPDAFRDAQGFLDRPAWVAALAVWRESGDVKSSGADLHSAGGMSSETAPTGEGQGRVGE